MAGRELPLTGVERFFEDGEVIVSKTDLKGRITYANETFQTVAGYAEKELIGAPHSIVRHPDMPRCIFKLLWDTIEAGREIFAYVINRCKNGDHYWVLAHVTPSFNADGEIVGYHSNRRVPDRAILDGTIIPLYNSLLEVEAKYENRKDGMNAALAAVVGLLDEKGVDYDEFFFSLLNPPKYRAGRAERPETPAKEEAAAPDEAAEAPESGPDGEPEAVAGRSEPVEEAAPAP